MSPLEQLEKAARELSIAVGALRFGSGVTHVYNPLDYAWESHAAYLKLGVQSGSQKKVLFLGMNPGPFGMAQTGVPFGEVAAVRDWMGICKPVGHPPQEHPRRPVEGFDCQRSEVSGQRLWGLFAERFGAAENFFADHFVVNYCPLLFLDAGEKHCRNLTPDKFAAADTATLYAACDAHLRTVIEVMQPQWVIGVGKFAEDRAYLALTGLSAKEAVKQQAGKAKTGATAKRGRPPKVATPAVAAESPSAQANAAKAALTGISPNVPLPKIGTVLHPSPASPIANRGWAAQATSQLQALGVW